MWREMSALTALLLLLNLSSGFIVNSVCHRCTRCGSELHVSELEDEKAEDHDAIVRPVFNDGLPLLDRREAVLGATSVLSLSLLHELFPSSLSAARSIPVAALQGDSIVRTLWLQRLSYPVLVVALETGLFEALKRKQLTLQQLGRSLTPTLSGHGRTLEALVGVLTSLKLLEMQNDGDHVVVALTEPARQVLLKDSPYFWGPQLMAADGLTGSLRRAVAREDAPIKEYREHSFVAVDSFIDSMQAHGSVTAQAAAESLDPIIGKSSARPAKHILDMAGGSGCFAEAFAATTQAQITLADVPQVVERFRSRKNRGNNIIRAVSADLFDKDSWPIGPDCHLLANVLHDWGNIDEILAASYHALTLSGGGGGRLVVIEQLLTDNKAGPLPAALASVSMLLGDWRTGKQYSFAELRAAAYRAGFSNVERGPHCGDFHTAVICYVYSGKKDPPAPLPRLHSI